MTTRMTFINSEEKRNLLERFRLLIKDPRFFNLLILLPNYKMAGYWWSSIKESISGVTMIPKKKEP